MAKYIIMTVTLAPLKSASQSNEESDGLRGDRPRILPFGFQTSHSVGTPFSLYGLLCPARLIQITERL
jgi:hypothetical protein